MNTNKNEAANRGPSASLPKNVTFSRNFSASIYMCANPSCLPNDEAQRWIGWQGMKKN